MMQTPLFHAKLGKDAQHLVPIFYYLLVLYFNIVHGNIYLLVLIIALFYLIESCSIAL